MKFVKYTSIGLASLYLLACGILYLGQDRIIFNPDQLPEDFRFRDGEEIEIKVDEGVYLNSIFLPSEQSKGVILYLHGNRGSNRRCLRQADGLRGNNYDILMPDYRGYGKSDGQIKSEKQLLNDVQKVYDYLSTRYDESKIVIVGYSLGTGMASYLAAQNNPSRLVLIAPYLSFYNLKDQWVRVIPDFLVKYPLNNQKYLKDVTCPITLFHGTSDEVIPYESSVTLAQLNPAAKLIPLDGTSHRGSIFSGLFRQTLSQMLRG
jgi:pimeloyl-ACP methyl ester carboxylesterase